MREFAKDFYTSRAWRRCSQAYMTSQNYICERCGGVATICHHKKHLTPKNISDPNITLCWQNLEALCKECHAIEHMAKTSRVYFNDDGQVERVREGKGIQLYKAEVASLNQLLDQLSAQKPEIGTVTN